MTIARSLSVTLKRDVRLAKYNVPHCGITLTVDVEEGVSLREAYDEVYSGVVVMVEEMVEKEIEKYKEIKQNANKNK